MTTHSAGEIPGFNGTRIAPAGVDWDAVGVPRFLGLQALNRLQGREGAIAMDTGDRTMYFLVPPGTTTGWNIQHSAALGETNHVVLPADEKEIPPGPYWLVSPRRGRLHTDTQALRAALEAALGPRDPNQPDLERLRFEQIQGWNCALCGAGLYQDRSLGIFRTDCGMLTTPTELWACAPQCR
ncbi:hypothetical protein ACFW0I_35070 [[Kitasatospora] papulosa]|uniref:hypothetical protein n=1 Tax=[Kitasatospora] papulosa TaxID=1464011 RepID=UPI0036A019A4